MVDFFITKQTSLHPFDFVRNLFHLLVITGIILVSAATVSKAPTPQNVTVGKIVKFNCATTNSQDIITWSTTPNIGIATVATQLFPDGGRRSVLSFTALLEHGNTIVRCIVTDINTVVSTIHSALVLVQGEPFYCHAISLLYILYRSTVSCW